MISQKVIVKNKEGFHLRPAANFCNETLKFPCQVKIRAHGSERNGKSMLGVLSACVKQNDEIEIICDGENEKEALTHLVDFVENHME